MKLPVIAAVLLAAATARADSPADKLFEEGQARYDAGDYEGAIARFQDAFKLASDPVYLFNIAQSYRKLFDCTHAAEYYQRYLDAATDADPKQRDKVVTFLRDLAPCVDQRKREVEAAREAERKHVEPASPRLVYSERDPGRRYRVAGFGVAGLGAAGLVLGVVFSRRGARLESELHDACTPGCEWTPALDAKDHAGSRANTIAVASYIGGGAALVGGAVLYVLGRSKPKERILVTPVPGGAAISARLRW